MPYRQLRILKKLIPLYLTMILLCACKAIPASSSWACEVLPVRPHPEFKMLTQDRLMRLNVGDKGVRDDVIIAATNNRDILTRDTAEQIVNANDAAKVNCP